MVITQSCNGLARNYKLSTSLRFARMCPHHVVRKCAGYSKSDTVDILKTT